MKGTVNQGYGYTDIALNDEAKFYFWYADEESCPANAQFVGRISKISAPLACESGYYRVFEGKLLGEVLTRRLKRNKSWIAEDADNIVSELASDLFLATSFSGDASDDYHVTLHVDVESYMDVLKKVSDYYVDSTHIVRKDFYVDSSNTLVWKTRPLRSGASVETLTVGKNIINYNILRDVEPVKNYITVFGTNGTNAQEGRCEPSGHDAWTYGSGWDPDYGTETSGAQKILGANSLLLGSEDVGGHETIQCHYDFSTALQGMGRSGYQLLKFYVCRDLLGAVPITAEVRLCTDATNYFYRNIVTEASNLNFVAVNSDLGDSQEYDAVLNPDGVWHTENSPDWFNINFIEFYFERTDTNDMYFYIDVLYFSRGRYRFNTSDAIVSIPAYGQRDLDIVDDNLKSDAECQNRAETLLYQLKDAPIRIDIETMGNTNLLIGDQLLLSVPAESINAQPYDILSVEHDFTKTGFKTKANMVNSSVTPTLINIRQLPCGTPYEGVAKKFDVQREIGRGLQIIK